MSFKQVSYNILFYKLCLGKFITSKNKKNKIYSSFKNLKMSTNFIKKNIYNIKGTRKPATHLQDQHKSRLSLPKHNNKYQNVVSQYKHQSINTRVIQMQKKLDQLSRNRTQSMIVQQITEIKDDIKMIKSHLFQQKKPSGFYTQDRQRNHTNSSVGGQQQENIYLTNGNNNRMRSQGSQNSFKQNQSKVTFVKNINESQNKMSRIKNFTVDELLNQHEKKHLNTRQGVSIKSIYPMLKEYKLQGPQFGTIFYGYSKRNSQPVAIKYIPSTVQTNRIIEVYDKMWKNIAKGKWPCINRIYDYKLQDNNFVIMQRNKSTIAKLPYKLILIDIFKSLQFIHECGFLYRNIEPEHFMLNQEGQLTVIDFQRAKRYIDVKGHLLQVNDNVFNGSTFASNNQVRGHQQGRKDDLQSLGYFALLLMQYDIPWYGLNKQQTIKVRSQMTLQQLFHGHQGWIQFMATVMKTGRNDRPDYRKLQQILQNL